MAEFKICSCGEKNSPTAIFCQKCQNDLMSVEITTEKESKENLQDSEELLNFEQLFSSAPVHKQATPEKRVIKQVNIKRDESDVKKNQSFKYCTCGEPNTATSARCTSCGADIKGINPETKEEHQARLKSIIESAQSLKPRFANVAKEDVSKVQPLVETSILSKSIVTTDSLLSIEPTTQKLVVGRGLSSGTKIEAYLSNKSYVSRKHMQIWSTNNGICIADLGSTNGTYLNGKKLEANTTYHLNVGDVLVLGKPNASKNEIAIFNVK